MQAARRPGSARGANNSAFTTEEDRTMLLMKHKGKEFDEIAVELGLGRTAADCKGRYDLAYTRYSCRDSFSYRV